MYFVWRQLRSAAANPYTKKCFLCKTWLYQVPWLHTSSVADFPEAFGIIESKLNFNSRKVPLLPSGVVESLKGTW